MSTSLAVIEKAGFVSLTQNMENLEQIMGKFGLSCRELDKLMENEYHHFACQMTDERIIRVYTKHCVFTINLDSARAAVAGSETVWMHAILKARESERQTKEDARKQIECMHLDLHYKDNTIRDHAREIGQLKAALTKNRQMCEEQNAALADFRSQLQSWKSRAMKMVAKYRKPKTVKAKKKGGAK